jgi:hypothetical protein
MLVDRHAEQIREFLQRYHIPASVRVLWGSALATLEPGHQDTFVNSIESTSLKI